MNLPHLTPSAAELNAGSFDPLCEECGYPLIGLDAARCPECGTPFDPNAPEVPDIPWMRRQHIGVVRAYVETAAQIIRHPVRFTRQMRRPLRIRLEDANAFRIFSVRCGVCGITITVLCILIPQNADRFARFDWPQGLLFGVVILVGVGFLAIILATCTQPPVTVWARYPNGRDLISIHRYASAPLAMWVPIAAAMMLITAAFELLGRPHIMVAPAKTMLAIAVGMTFFLTWWIPQVVFQHAVHRSRWAAMRMGIYLLFYWLLPALLFGITGFVIVCVLITFSALIVR